MNELVGRGRIPTESQCVQMSCGFIMLALRAGRSALRDAGHVGSLADALRTKVLTDVMSFMTVLRAKGKNRVLNAALIY